MSIRHILGLLLLFFAIACLGMSQRDSVRRQPGQMSKHKGWVPSGPVRDVPLSSFDRVGSLIIGVRFGLGGIYCFAMPWIHRKKDDAKPALRMETADGRR